MRCCCRADAVLQVRERAFIDKVVATVKAGGRVLIPIVAIGRAQVGHCQLGRGGRLGGWGDRALGSGRAGVSGFRPPTEAGLLGVFLSHA